MEQEQTTHGTVRLSTILIRILDVARILIFNQSWQVRHGASLILRAAALKAEKFVYFDYRCSPNNFKTHRGESIKDLRKCIKDSSENSLKLILQDSIIRNLLILGLDRFSDYADDQSNIIVRKISSQAIAHSLKFLKDKKMTVRMMEYFKDLLGKDISNGWEPKQGSIFLMT